VGRERPDGPGLLAVLGEHDVEYVVTGSVAALLVGVDVDPGDLDVTPALDRPNLERLARALDALGARQYEDEPFGRWTTEPSGERRWVTFEPTDADRAARAAWRPDPNNVDSFDHLLWTRLGSLDVVPEIAGTYEELGPRALAVVVEERPILVESLEDQLATLTVPRREKDRPRVEALRLLQRGVRSPRPGRA
jgi:hypothetical protein